VHHASTLHPHAATAKPSNPHHARQSSVFRYVDGEVPSVELSGTGPLDVRNSDGRAVIVGLRFLKHEESVIVARDRLIMFADYGLPSKIPSLNWLPTKFCQLLLQRVFRMLVVVPIIFHIVFAMLQ
jgi:hypothetical protein